MSSVSAQAQFARRLADAGEHDPVARDAGGAGAQQFAPADHVGAGALAREQPQDGEVVVRLHRVVHMRVQPGGGERGGQRPVARAHRGGGVDPGRRADTRRRRGSAARRRATARPWRAWTARAARRSARHRSVRAQRGRVHRKSGRRGWPWGVVHIWAKVATALLPSAQYRREAVQCVARGIASGTCLTGSPSLAPTMW